jgi:hypothetical protein
VRQNIETLLLHADTMVYLSDTGVWRQGAKQKKLPKGRRWRRWRR